MHDDRRNVPIWVEDHVVDLVCKLRSLPGGLAGDDLHPHRFDAVLDHAQFESSDVNPDEVIRQTFRYARGLGEVHLHTLNLRCYRDVQMVPGGWTHLAVDMLESVALLETLYGSSQSAFHTLWLPWFRSGEIARYTQPGAQHGYMLMTHALVQDGSGRDEAPTARLGDDTVVFKSQRQVADGVDVQAQQPAQDQDC